MFNIFCIEFAEFLIKENKILLIKENMKIRKQTNLLRLITVPHQSNQPVNYESTALKLFAYEFFLFDLKTVFSISIYSNISIQFENIFFCN